MHAVHAHAPVVAFATVSVIIPAGALPEHVVHPLESGSGTAFNAGGDAHVALNAGTGVPHDGHGEHALAPAAGACENCGHATQAVAPGAGEYDPAAHEPHIPVGAALDVPAGQGVHAVVDAANEPAAHTEHAVWAESVASVYSPSAVTQFAQSVAPLALLYVPAGHDAQCVAPLLA